MCSEPKYYETALILMQILWMTAVNFMAHSSFHAGQVTAEKQCCSVKVCSCAFPPVTVCTAGVSVVMKGV